MRIIPRPVPQPQADALRQAGVHPLLAQLYAARGVCSAQELDEAPACLLAPTDLLGMDAAVDLLARAIAQRLRICIVADYDCDGATACAVAWRGLRLLGAAEVDYLVPDRIADGYGLTAPIARRVKDSGAQVLLTVDNGIASVDGVAQAKALGMQVLITDHHLPGAQLPQADALVNPNQPGCTFASKALAGVGVMFYVLLALRAELRRRGHFSADRQPRLEALLPLVALGTVADVVPLDANNRRLVALGLKRIRRGQMPPGLHALFDAAGRKHALASTFDLGFAIGPRINAAGRLADMGIGIACLCSQDTARATELAQALDAINRQRRDIESGMRVQALRLVEDLCADTATMPAALCVFDAGFHEGVVGIVAARIKDRLHRPCFVFAASNAPGCGHEIKGSGRSIAGFHLRDALDLVAKRQPGLLLRFGGHAMAAGCTIARTDLPRFAHALAQVAQERLDAATLQRCLHTDGPLRPEWRDAELITTLHRQVWGQGFAAPTFSEEMQVLSQRLVGEKHLKLQLAHGGDSVDGIWFGRTEPLPARALLAYRPQVSEWRGQQRVEFVVEALHAQDGAAPEGSAI